MDMDLSQTVWGKRIDEAEARGGFTPEDVIEAEGWTTCACGRATADISRSGIGAPVDDRLARLGVQFLSAVEGDAYAQASALLESIELRAGEVAGGKQ